MLKLKKACEAVRNYRPVWSFYGIRDGKESWDGWCEDKEVAEGFGCRRKDVDYRVQEDPGHECPICGGTAPDMFGVLCPECGPTLEKIFAGPETTIYSDENNDDNIVFEEDKDKMNRPAINPWNAR